ncbi:ribonucleotide reductase N-terminal alpha domain-containing protein [Methanosarcina horonobensis]|uniref:ribonucleotide reductase N-terminal alpha domain-containing protein n=1 Tax=Methanosarcina horonobensis TaxID=418008 RepID=UPI000ADA4A5F|nr:ribonucleotide reductase N-terminal alpha domain-containing protein [Methanosarcina horonobensis]
MSETKEGLDLLAAETLRSRYLREGEEDWKDVCERVAKAVATTTEEYTEFFNLMNSKVFLPSSPTLMNAGTASGQLSACFVIPVEDSIEEIFDSVKTAALYRRPEEVQVLISQKSGQMVLLLPQVPVLRAVP